MIKGLEIPVLGDNFWFFSVHKATIKVNQSIKKKKKILKDLSANEFYGYDQ